MNVKQLLQGQMENHLLPFLWVHGEDEAMYRKMVGVIDGANIKAFCVEARPHDGFCQDAWWHDMDIILDEAEKRGMKVWILDDKHFPTGFANGQALKAPKELRRQSIFLKTLDASGEVKLDLQKHCHPTVLTKHPMYLVTDIAMKNMDKDVQFDDDRVFSVSAIKVGDPSQILDLSEYVKNGILIWRAPEGQWKLQICCLSRNLGTHRSYINMMDKESCRIQIDAVYEPHYAHYKDKFGTVIAGFFSDEPELGNNYMYRSYNTLGTNQDLPWSRELEAALTERLGENVNRLLPLLWVNDADPSLTAKVRYTYMDCVSRLVEEDFSHQIGQWCRDRGVDYIGHVIEDNNQHARTGTSLGHYFRGLKWQSMAGIDDIGGQVYPGGENVKRKNIFGYIDDGEFYHYTLGKLGSSLGALNPNMQGRTMCEIFGNYGWKEGVQLEHYLVNHFMVRGINHFVPHAFTCSPYPEKDCPPHFYAQGNNPQYRHFGKLMLYTNRVCNLISGGQVQMPIAVLYHAEAEWTGKAMLDQTVARELLDHQIDFAFVPADVFGETEFYKTTIDGTLTVNGHTFRVLVIPYSQFITPETARAVEALTATGGRVLVMDALPDGLTNGEPLPESLTGITVLPLGALHDTLQSYQTVKLYPSNNRIRAMHYQGQNEVVYLFNESDTRYAGVVQVPLSGPVIAYNAWDNRLEKLDMTKDGIRIELPPYHSLLILSADGLEAEEPFRIEGKATPLTSFLVSTCRSIDYPAFREAKAYDPIVSYDKIDPKFSGFIRYETEFEAKEGKIYLEITDAREGVEVFVNGNSAGIKILPPYRYDLTDLCREGINHLTIEVATTLERERGSKDPAPTGITGKVFLYK